MNIHYKQSQFELFPGEGGAPKTAQRFRLLFSSVTLPAENIVVLGIFTLMMMIFFFSVGVERGKKLAAYDKKVLVQDTVSAPSLKTINPSSVTPSNTRAVTTLGSPGKFPETKLEKAPSFDIESNVEEIPSLVEKPYTIQVASFKGPVYANKEATNLQKSGHETFIITKGNYVILCVGKFPEKNKAQTLLTQMKKKYKDCLIRRL